MDDHYRLQCPCKECYLRRTLTLKFGALSVQKDRAEKIGDRSEVLRLQKEMEELTEQYEEVNK